MTAQAMSQECHVEPRTFRLVHQAARSNAAKFCMEAPEGWEVKFSEPAKNREQEEKYHAMIGDIAKQCEFMGRKFDREDWKRLLLDAFARYMHELGTPLSHGGRVVPSLDGAGIVQLGVQSRRLRKREASDFIEFLHAFGAERGVRWSAQYGR